MLLRLSGYRPGRRYALMGSGDMSKTDKHIKCAAQTVENFKQCLETSDAHAIADLICDLGHGPVAIRVGICWRSSERHNVI
jgi:hypothetical protein